MFALTGPVNKDALALIRMGDGFYPYVYTSPKDELLACRETAWLGSHLNVSPVYDVSGPEVVKLLNYVCVNRDYSTLAVGASRHAIICNDKGQMLADGVLFRVDEKTYRTYWLAPVLSYYVDTLGMDVQGNWITDDFFFQIDGPKSLEIMEKVSQCNLHDLKFAQNKMIKVAGIDTRIHRLGMSGCLAYEMHGDRKDAETVFDAIVEAGRELGLRKLGSPQYCRNHTQGGYPNQWIHYWYPWHSSGEGLSQHVNQCMNNNILAALNTYPYPFFGSASDDPQNAFLTPYDVDWASRIDYNHDFVGKEALLEIKKNPPRKVVTLEWNAEDIGTVFASQFLGTDVEPADEIITIGDGGDAPFVMSKVIADGKMIGMTSGRTRDYYYRKMLSLAFIKKEYAVEGSELIVIWGAPGTPQKEIRAKIARFPYYNEEYRNETFDVKKIPYA